jgi:hypothetical protein
MVPVPPAALREIWPLYDPDPKKWNLRRALGSRNIHRCNLSDFATVTLLVLREAKHLTVKQVEVFNTTFGTHARIRAGHKHQGHPALAPDKTVMQAYVGTDARTRFPRTFNGGNATLAVRDPPWTPETVNKCPGYKKWLADLKRQVGSGGPFPPRAKLAQMNADASAWEEEVAKKKKASKA